MSSESLSTAAMTVPTSKLSYHVPHIAEFQTCRVILQPSRKFFFLGGCGHRGSLLPTQKKKKPESFGFFIVHSMTPEEIKRGGGVRRNGERIGLIIAVRETRERSRIILRSLPWRQQLCGV